MTRAWSRRSFEPGFSTRPHSDALAGRGMGLNIVERTIAHMGGEVKLDYQAGVFHALSPLGCAQWD